ncbi:PhzF family phenazine biosynthesis protein [Aquimarina sp. 2201CG14-23]|uniref:PhzF family phenazine biosynthesis protein n=1 Tax=Aquimarina mycalae TaxID=3040073 RepID=UPI002477E79F|nr:PhzF family phenazine biosynthesis isomerase [Aquimarina sp. 2201CG14-23]MDH7446427.1 PhzF family phenazine biosynthesis isomerase [Aquimarina sp. 2201CG14-23]
MIKTCIVDSFTNEAFKGNPAGVCTVETNISEDNMLLIAQELGLSETAFIKKLEKEHAYSIRYFSPKMEIPLCGHATLAAAKVIFETTNFKEIHFNTIQNIDLHIVHKKDGIEMSFPVYQTIPTEVPSSLLKALGIEKIVNTEYNKETNIILIEMDDTVLLQKLKPDFEALYKSIDSINGVLITAASTGDDYDFHSRYFWPWSGTNEDSVTGGTHTFLTPYWSKRLGKTTMKSFQSSSRTGYMEVTLINDQKLVIKSNAVIVFEGNLKLDIN